jgi:hypothetical protein
MRTSPPPTTFSLATLQAGLDSCRGAPRESGSIELIVCRPTVGERRLLDEAELSLTGGLIGDNWHVKPSSKLGRPNPDAELTMMSARAAALIAGPREQWPLAGDQLYVEFDISEANVPPGTRLAVGTAEIEITDHPHTGCGKFIRRFGVDAQKFVNSPDGRALNLRGINARIVRGGIVRTGDTIAKR